MSALFKLLTAVLVLVYCAENSYYFLLHHERYRTRNSGAVSLCRINDLFGSGANQPQVLALYSYSDLLIYCHLAFLLDSEILRGLFALYTVPCVSITRLTKPNLRPTPVRMNANGDFVRRCRTEDAQRCITAV